MRIKQLTVVLQRACKYVGPDCNKYVWQSLLRMTVPSNVLATGLTLELYLSFRLLHLFRRTDDRFVEVISISTHLVGPAITDPPNRKLRMKLEEC